jgi:hypothetical protein
MSRVPMFSRLLAAVLLSGCATSPMGPTAMVMPAQGKPFEVFAQEQAMCKQFAGGEVDGGATMSNLKQLGTMAVSTVLGAGLGASVRGRRGAEFGGAVGAIGGAAMAGQGSTRDQYSLQGRYNLAYTQCMYSRGNQVATAARATPQIAYGSPPGGSPGGYQGGPGYPQGPGYSQSAGYPQSPGSPPPGFNPQGYGMVR